MLTKTILLFLTYFLTYVTKTNAQALPGLGDFWNPWLSLNREAVKYSLSMYDQMSELGQRAAEANLKLMAGIRPQNQESVLHKYIANLHHFDRASAEEMKMSDKKKGVEKHEKKSDDGFGNIKRTMSRDIAMPEKKFQMKSHPQDQVVEGETLQPDSGKEASEDELVMKSFGSSNEKSQEKKGVEEKTRKSSQLDEGNAMQTTSPHEVDIVTEKLIETDDDITSNRKRMENTTITNDTTTEPIEGRTIVAENGGMEMRQSVKNTGDENLAKGYYRDDETVSSTTSSNLKGHFVDEKYLAVTDQFSSDETESYEKYGEDNLL